MKNNQLLRIEFHQLGFVFDVYEDASLAVRDCEFRLASQRKRARDGTAGGVDGGGILARTIHGEDALGGGIVTDSVGVCSYLDGAEGLESFQIEGGYGVRAPVTGETAADVRGNSNAMHALGIGDLASHGTTVGVEYHDPAPVRHV